MKLLINYLKEHILNIVTTGLVLIIFHITLFLYQINIEVIFYADVVSLLLLVCVFIYSFSKYQKRIEAINYLKNNIFYSEYYPDTNYLADQIYQTILDEVVDEYKSLNDQKNQESQALIEYYTLWVHQIKTPIAAMRLILEEKDDIDLKIELLKIEQYVEMVLSYLRLNSESSDYLFEKIDLDKCIRDVIKDYAPIFIRKKIKLEYESQDYQFISDEKWFCFGLGQILSNALKYSKTGSKINIDFKDNILIVEDFGIGIKKEDLPRIFEKGYSGYVGRNDKRATGIGLYLTKTIMDRLNHRIWIESIPHEGTKFYIDLNQERKVYD